MRIEAYRQCSIWVLLSFMHTMDRPTDLPDRPTDLPDSPSLSVRQAAGGRAVMVSSCRLS